MATKARTDSQLDEALAAEFRDYLGEVARQIVGPVERSVTGHKAEVDRLVVSTSELRRGLEQDFSAHRTLVAEETERLIRQFRANSVELTETVSSVAEGHETTRRALLDLAANALEHVTAAVVVNEKAAASLHAQLVEGVTTMRNDVRQLAQAMGATILASSKAAIESRADAIVKELPTAVLAVVEAHFAAVEAKVDSSLFIVRLSVALVVLQSIAIAALVYQRV